MRINSSQTTTNKNNKNNENNRTIHTKKVPSNSPGSGCGMYQHDHECPGANRNQRTGLNQRSNTPALWQESQPRLLEAF
jgi:hypothetical protein